MAAMETRLCGASSAHVVALGRLRQACRHLCILAAHPLSCSTQQGSRNSLLHAWPGVAGILPEELLVSAKAQEHLPCC